MTIRARGGRLGVVGAVALGLILATPAPALGHSYLVSSTPEEGGTLTELPAEFTVTMNEPLLDVSGEAAGFALQVRDGAGDYYGDGCLTVSGSTLATAAALGAPGEYTIGWRIVSADGHTVDGTFSFSWEPTDGFTPAEGAAAPPTCGTSDASDGPAQAGPDEGAPDSGPEAEGNTDLLWVLGTVVVVGVALFGTLLLLTRRRRSGAAGS